MLKAKEIRGYAKEALTGRWLKAGFVSVVAGVLGASIGTTGMSISSSSEELATESEWFEPFVDNLGSSTEVSAVLMAIVLGIALILLLWAIAILVIGGATTLGYAKYNLNLVDDNDPKIKDLFSQYNRLGNGFGMQFFRNLYVTLWSLLFLIPGIIANFSYYMTPFILCENPDMTAREAIKESKQLMKGNKWRLFCLEFSFYGWYLLSAFVMIVVMLAALVPMIVVSGGFSEAKYMIAAAIIVFIVSIIYLIAVSLILSPYITASVAVFYREICREKFAGDYSGTDVVDSVYENILEKDDFEYIEL